MCILLHPADHLLWVTTPSNETRQLTTVSGYRWHWFNPSAISQSRNWFCGRETSCVRTERLTAEICADNPGLSSDSALLNVMMGADVQGPATVIGSSVSECFCSAIKSRPKGRRSCTGHWEQTLQVIYSRSNGEVNKVFFEKFYPRFKWSIRHEKIRLWVEYHWSMETKPCPTY